MVLENCFSLIYISLICCDVPIQPSFHAIQLYKFILKIEVLEKQYFAC